MPLSNVAPGRRGTTHRILTSGGEDSDMANLVSLGVGHSDEGKYYCQNHAGPRGDPQHSDSTYLPGGGDSDAAGEMGGWTIVEGVHP